MYRRGPPATRRRCAQVLIYVWTVTSGTPGGGSLKRNERLLLLSVQQDERLLCPNNCPKGERARSRSLVRTATSYCDNKSARIGFGRATRYEVDPVNAAHLRAQ